MLEAFSELEKLITRELPKLYMPLPLNYIQSRLKRAGVRFKEPVETYDDNTLIKLLYTHLVKAACSKINTSIDKNASKTPTPEKLAIFIKQAFIKLCSLTDEYNNLKSSLERSKSIGKIDEGRWSRRNEIMNLLGFHLITLIHKLQSDYGNFLPKELLLQYHPHWENLRKEKLELENEYERQFKQYCQYVGRKINIAKTPSDALQYLLNEIRKGEILAVQPALYKTQSLVSEKWYLNKQIEYLKVQADYLRQTMGTVIAEKNLEKIHKPTVFSSQASALKLPLQLDYTNLNTYFYPEKAENFKKVDAGLLENGYLNDSGKWIGKNKDLVALIHILVKLNYLRPIKGKNKHTNLLEYRRFFEKRYSKNISQQMKPSRFKEELLDSYRFTFSFIPGISQH